MNYYVYLLTNSNNSVLYLGRTENLEKRIEQHRLKLADSFTKKYNVTKLVYFEIYNSPQDAANREWKIKKWKREWKENLINEKNPNWQDLYNELLKDLI